MKNIVISALLLLSAFSAVSGQAFDTVDVIIRDFNASHPDFQENPHPCGPFMVKGLVEDTLDANRNPVPVADFPTICNESAAQLHIGDWFSTTNQSTEYCIPIIMAKVPGQENTYRIDEQNFFPLDTVPTNTEPLTGDDNLQHNFHFCLEMHATFRYRGGEVFSFSGDDDVWVFINNKLAIDLGNVHQEQGDSILLDESVEELGISVGGYYNFDFFYCERQSTGSHMKVTSSFDLLPPPPPGLHIADKNQNIILNDTVYMYQDGIPDTLTSVRIRNASEEEVCITIETQVKELFAGTWALSGVLQPVGERVVIGPDTPVGTYQLLLSDGTTQDMIYVTMVERPQAATPVISPVTPFAAYSDITIASSTPGAVIYYTLDGSVPVPGVSPQYSSAIRLTNTTTVKAIATVANYRPSAVATALITRSHTQSTLEVVDGAGNPLDTIYSNAASINVRLNTNYYDSNSAVFSAASGGDAETLRLVTVTTPKTGFAAAYLDNYLTDSTAAIPGNGTIEIAPFTQIIVTWTNPLDPSDVATDIITVVPAPKQPSVKFTDAGGNPITVISELQGNGFKVVVTGNTINPNAPDVLTLTLTSDDGDQMTVNVTETGARTGEYVSDVIPFKFSQVITPGDGVIEGKLDNLSDDSTATVTAQLGSVTSDLIIISGFVRVQSAWITDGNKDGAADSIYIRYAKPLRAPPNTITSIDWPAEEGNGFTATFSPDPSLSEIGFFVGPDGVVDSTLVVVVLKDANEIFPSGQTSPSALEPPKITVDGFEYALEDKVQPVLTSVQMLASSLERYKKDSDQSIHFYPDTLILTLSEPIIADPNYTGSAWDQLLILKLDSSTVPVKIQGTVVQIDSITYRVVIDNSDGLVTPKAADDIALNPAAPFSDNNLNKPNELPVPVAGENSGISSVTNQFRHIISGIDQYGPNFGTESIVVIADDGSVMRMDTVPRLADVDTWVPPAQLRPDGTIDPLMPCGTSDVKVPVTYPAGCLVSLIVLTEKSDGPYTSQVQIFDNLGHFVQSLRQDYGRCGEYENYLRETEYGQYANDIVWNQRDSQGQLVGNGVYIWKVQMKFDDGKQKRITKLMGIVHNNNMLLDNCAAPSASP